MVFPSPPLHRTDLDAQLCGVEDGCDEHGLPVRRIAHYDESRTVSSTAASSTTEGASSGARNGGGSGGGSTKEVHLLPGPLGSGAYGTVHKGTWQVGSRHPRAAHPGSGLQVYALWRLRSSSSSRVVALYVVPEAQHQALPGCCFAHAAPRTCPTCHCCAGLLPLPAQPLASARPVHQGRTVAVKVVADMHMVGHLDERLLESFTHEVEVGVRTQRACLVLGAELNGTSLCGYAYLLTP